MLSDRRPRPEQYFQNIPRTIETTSPPPSKSFPIIPFRQRAAGFNQRLGLQRRCGMSVAKLFEPLSLAHGQAMKNRFMLAPLTNEQSHPDGRLSEEGFRWLTMRAEGGFALTMTCAMHVQAVRQGFGGQLGIFGDQHLEGLTRLASAIKARGSIAAAQLHHAGKRAPKHLVGTSVCPSDDEKTGARALSLAEVEKLRDDFVAAATRG